MKSPFRLWSFWLFASVSIALLVLDLVGVTR